MSALKKGETLVEVLVSVAVFSIVCAGVFSCLLGIRRVNQRQKEYVRFEMICRDIAYFAPEQLNAGYFGGEAKPEEEKWVVHYDSDFKVTEESSAYRLEYSYESGSLVVSVYHAQTGKVIVDSLVYGG